MTDKPSRKDHILQKLVSLLEQSEHQRITTALLAKEAGISEAALYKHFPSKARMFEDIIDFIEKTLFTRINFILQEDKNQLHQLEQISRLVLLFAEKNPGLCKILTREALVHEHNRLQGRIEQLFNRIETQIRQILKDAEIVAGMKPALLKTTMARFLLHVMEGRINHYVRSNFMVKPTDDWNAVWLMLQSHLFIMDH